MKLFNFFTLICIFLILVNCKEKRFLNDHEVILVTNFINGDEKLREEAKIFESKTRIKFNESNKIYLRFISKYEKTDTAQSRYFYPSLIIDGYYLYSFKNIKTEKVAAFGTGVNANTGQIRQFKEVIWLNEKSLNQISKRS
ncbi:hypothetical protein ATE47_06585 [Chryseobacterium sp. IHB B 17019]|uniref:hypothetical protein n=1 Tax=Chryseobacterium sp. IHB B 17019 TaxID=1721091 RepID=UPI00071FDD27|nr:hypothetical protein [Chryseobacterium sp. IHB B 17019]ALR30211.1 hypothetical protein ATE47_06585 [Chryseobacterium sp. IHB B 17019]